MRRLKRSALATAAASLALALAGCGGDDSESSEDTPEPVVSNTVDVSMAEYDMTPSNIMSEEEGLPTSQAEPGEVTFNITNDGEETHSFVFNNVGQEIPIDEGELAPGESAELTVEIGESGGFFEYYCPIADHDEQGMQGQLEVVDDAFDAEEAGSESESDAGAEGSVGY